MRKVSWTVLAISTLVGAAGISFGAHPAAAAGPAGHVPIPSALQTYVQPVAWAYVKTKHGARYRVKRPGYGYYYGGYWYARPWWTIGIAPVGPVVVYNPIIHGPRYVVKRPGYVYRHGGYWYRRRWW